MVEWIKPGLNIDWVGGRKLYFGISGLFLAASVFILLVNFIIRGAPLNYGTDFKGGSEIQIEFAKSVDVGQVRAALNKSGFKEATVVKVTDVKRPNFFMLRLSEISAFSADEQTRLKQSLETHFKDQIARFDHKSGSDKIYIHFKKDLKKTDPTLQTVPVEKQIESVFQKGNVEAQQIQRFGKTEDNIYEVTLAGMDRDIRRVFDSALGAGTVKEAPQIEAVGAKMGKQLRDAGIKSIIYSLLLIFLYVAIRFDFRYAPGGVLSLMHDVIITIGLLSLLWKEFSMTAIAALMTLAGYSINDTIVVYDRIRENMVKYRDRRFDQIINASINETLSRTILTSLATFLTSAAMWLLGAGDVALFSFIFSFGIIIGTYSSIAIASPLTLWLNDKFTKKLASKA